MNILVDAALPGLDAAFPPPFRLTRYHHAEEIPNLLPSQDILLCRSTLKVNASLLGLSKSLQIVATASSGRDHLDELFLKAQGIQIIDAKGANAQSVADYVLACLAYLDTLGKLKGKKLGVIGMGFVGQAVSMHMQTLGFDLLHYDPPKALLEPNFKSCSLTALQTCNLLCIHAALHQDLPYPSQDLLDQAFLSQLNEGTVLINASRGAILNEEALLAEKKSLIYCTDVYLNEPQIDPRIVDRALICTPHIAGHSMEAKYAAIALVSQKLHQFFGLKPVACDAPTQGKHQIEKSSLSWQERVLLQYHPLDETQILKKANNKSQAFLQIRAKHQRRYLEIDQTQGG